MKTEKQKTSYRLCQISWCLIGVIFLAAVWLNRKGISLCELLQLFPPCIFRTLTGYYCPGCGGTRAVLALLQVHLLQSFCYHPIVLYTAALYVWYLLSNTIEWLSRGRIPVGSRYHQWYGIAAAVIVMVHWILQNGILIFQNISR